MYTSHLLVERFPHCCAEEDVLDSLGPIEHEGPAARRLQRGGICQAMTTAAFTSFCQVNVAELPLCPVHHLRATAHSVTLIQQRVFLGKSLMIALRLSPPYRSRLFGFGTALSALLLSVVAARNRCRAGGWHIVEAARLAPCSSMFLLFVLLFMSQPFVMRSPSPCHLVAPVCSGKRTFHALKFRGHSETMC